MSNAIKFQFTCRDCGNEVDANYTPERQPPLCADHDSPAFSDPGNPSNAECQFEFCPKCNGPITDDELKEQGDEAAADQAESDREMEAADHRRAIEENYSNI